MIYKRPIEIGRVSSVQVGAVAPLGPEGTPSGFLKRPVAGPIDVGPLGLGGDAQADLRVHGGPEKAVYAYAASRYAEWAADYPEHAAILHAGAFGENLTIEGFDEGDICVGDVHAIGTSRLQVCQPRQPCFKLGLRFADPRMPPAMVINGRSGWYYRVLQSGVLDTGEALRLVERPNPDFRFDRLVAIVSGRGATTEELERLADMDGLASGVKRLVRRALSRHLAA
jgi:MOSC domain-containing protein YiiM